MSDTLSSQLVLKKNPGYWQTGRPYLDSLTFKTVGSDEAAYEAMLAGQGQVYEDMSTPSLVKQAAQHFNVENQLSTSPYDLQLNTLAPPFNNKLAREAIYAATDFAPILQHVFSNLYPVTQGFTGPGGICYEPTVPGYPPYDLAKAKALVQQLGGLTVNLGTIQNLVAQETTEALQTEWNAAGIKTTIASYPLAGLIAQFTSKKWQAMVQTAGSYDPAAGVGVASGSARSRRSAGCTTRTWMRCSTRPRARSTRASAAPSTTRPPPTSPSSSTVRSTSASRRPTWPSRA